MNTHNNARQTPRGREHIVLQVLGGQTPRQPHELPGFCPRTARKWLKRYLAEGQTGLNDRESRGAGWEFVHVAIDDASRLAYSQILPDEKKQSAIAFLKALVDIMPSPASPSPAS